MKHRAFDNFFENKASGIIEIYTHVSSNSLKNIKNPFGDLEI